MKVDLTQYFWVRETTSIWSTEFQRWRPSVYSASEWRLLLTVVIKAKMKVDLTFILVDRIDVIWSTEYQRWRVKLYLTWEFQILFYVEVTTVYQRRFHRLSINGDASTFIQGQSFKVYSTLRLRLYINVDLVIVFQRWLINIYSASDIPLLFYV